MISCGNVAIGWAGCAICEFSAFSIAVAAVSAMVAEYPVGHAFMSHVSLFTTSEICWCISVVRWVWRIIGKTITTHLPGHMGWEGGVCGCIRSIIVSSCFVTICCIGCIRRNLSSRGCTCSLDYWIICWWFAQTVVTGCSSHGVEMLYGVWVEVNSSFCLSVLVSCCGICIFYWGAGV